MTRLQRLSPILLGAMMAACSEAQPYLQPVAPAAGQAVVVDAGLGDRTARLDLRAMAAYALQATSTVHRWVPADVVRYDVELRVRNATTATQYDAVGSGLTAQVPVNANAAGLASFMKLRQGSFYRAYVKAMGRKDGHAGTDAIVQMNAQAQNDHVDFDFTATNDLAQEVSRTVTVHFDGVAFSGTGALSFGTPSPGAYVGPSADAEVVVSAPPTPTGGALASLAGAFAVGLNPVKVVTDAQSNAWVLNSGSGTVTKLASNGSVLGTFSAAAFATGMTLDAQGNLWVSGYVNQNVVAISSQGSALGSFGVGYQPQGLAFDAQGNLWVANNNGSNVTKLSSLGAALATHSVSLRPSDVAHDAQGNVWVAHANTSNLTKLNSQGSVLGQFSVGNPKQLLFDAQGQLWVPSQNNNLVVKLASDGGVLASYSVGATPTGLAFDAQGRLWVSHGSAGGPGVTVLASNGSVLATHSVGPSSSIAVAANGSVWVVQTNAGTVSLLRPSQP